jgi:hypothetical protein
VSCRLYLLTETGEHFAIVTVNGDHIAYATRRVARDLARLLNLLDPTPEQLAELLGADAGRATLRKVERLRSDAPCLRCGQIIPSADRAWWSPHTRLVRHVGRCPIRPSRRRGDPMSEIVCPSCGRQLPPELVLASLLALTTARPRSERVAERRGELWAQVAVYLAEHPHASANAVQAEVGGRRQDVLRAVREVRNRFLSAGNHAHEVTP